MVLLEDVDALLEERQLADFKRSALVSGESRVGGLGVGEQKVHTGGKGPVG